MDAKKTIDQAVRAFRAGRGNEGRELLEKVLKYQPTNQQAVQVLAQVQQQTNRALVTLDTLKRAAEAQPQNAQVHELMANYLLGGDPRAAEQSARAAVRLAPGAGAAHSLLGEALLSQRKFQEAAQSFQQAARFRPNDPQPVIRLAEVLRRANRPDDAVNLLRNVTTTPNLAKSPELRHALGQLLGQLGRTDEAIDAFRDAIRVRPNFASAHGSLGMLLQRAGRLDEA